MQMLIPFFRTLAFLILITPILQSCGGNEHVVSSGPFQKRKYQKGWHSELASKEQKSLHADEEQRGENDPGEEHEGFTLPDAGELEASLDPILPEEEGDEIEDPNGDCDIITKRDGEEIEAKVKAVGQDEIEYKKCGREDGPLYTIDKNEVFMIKYPDGSKDVFEKEEEEEEEAEPREPRPAQVTSGGGSSGEEDSGADGAGIAGFIISMLTLFLLIAFFASAIGGLFWLSLLLSLLAVIFSGVGDSGWATAGLILSILELIACLLILGLAIALVTA